MTPKQLLKKEFKLQHKAADFKVIGGFIFWTEYENKPSEIKVYIEFFAN